MNNQRRKEGYLLVENRHAPGPTEAMIDAMRKAGHEPFVPPPGVFEAATITCTHCSCILIRNPLRTRPREYCAKCDHYICDACSYIAKSHPHRPHISFIQYVDTMQNHAVNSLGKG